MPNNHLKYRTAGRVKVPDHAEVDDWQAGVEGPASILEHSLDRDRLGLKEGRDGHLRGIAGSTPLSVTCQCDVSIRSGSEPPRASSTSMTSNPGGSAASSSART